MEKELEDDDREILDDEDFKIYKSNYDKALIETINERSETYSYDDFDEEEEKFHESNGVLAQIKHMDDMISFDS
jgi:hypothetical protein